MCDFHGHDRPGFCQDRHGHTGFGAICGTKGRIEIPEFTNPQRATLFVDGEACLRAGLTHRARITPQQSVAVMALMDEVCRQNGLVFPFEAA